MDVEDLCFTAPTYFYNKTNQNIKLCKQVCQTLKKQKAPREITAHNKWKTYLIEYTIDWKYMYVLPIKLTNETKLRAFQFKFLNRIVKKTHIYINVNKLPLVFATFALLIMIPCNICSGKVNTLNIFWPILPVKSLHNLKKQTCEFQKYSLVPHTKRKWYK